jgi:hypothetical protein
MNTTDIEKMLVNLTSPPPPEDLKTRCLATIPVTEDAQRPTSWRVFGGRHARWALGAVSLVIATVLLLSLPRGSDALAATLRALALIHSAHWIGQERVQGKMQPTEMWFKAEPPFVARRVGNHLTLDDGKTRLSYQTGDRTAWGRTSSLLKQGRGGFTGAALLGELVADRNGAKPGVRVSRTRGTTPDGRSAIVLEIEDNSHPTHRAETRILIDPETELLAGFQSYHWEDGDYVLSSSVDTVEYNLPIAAELPSLPSGVRVTMIDNERRANQRIRSVTTPLGNEAILRAVDIAENGDVYLLLGRGLLMMPRASLTDDRGQTYTMLPKNVFWRDSVYQIFRPTTPRLERAPLPKRFTMRADVEFGYSLAVKDQPKESFRLRLDGIPAPQQTFSGVPPFEPFIDLWKWDP